MDIAQLLQEMKEIQNNFLNYIESQNTDEDDYLHFVSSLETQGIKENKHKVRSLLHLISVIATNHQRTSSFYRKIEKAILFLKEQISANFSNTDIFTIFQKNKKILLFLLEQKILIFDNYFYQKITHSKNSLKNYQEYFYPEYKDFMEKANKPILNKNLPENYNEKRHVGQNHHQICVMIQSDQVKEFIVYATKTNLPLNSNIKGSIYETNPFLINKEPTLIEYAAFYGSIQIFKYLQLNGVELTSSLWLFSIHGNSPEIIHLLEENKIKPKLNDYKTLFKESIKCHHNDIANYFLNNYSNEIKEEVEMIMNCEIDTYVKELPDNNIIEEEESFSKSFVSFPKILKYYNYSFIEETTLKTKSSFYYLCQYDYAAFVSLLHEDFDINRRLKRIITKYKNYKYDCGFEDEHNFVDYSKYKYFDNYRHYIFGLNCIELDREYRRLNKIYNKRILPNRKNKNEYIEEKDEINDEEINETIQIIKDDTDWQPYHLNEKKTALNFAIEKENIEIVKILLNIENIDIFIRTEAYSQKFCVHNGSRYDWNETTSSFAHAVEKNNFEIAKLLIEKAISTENNPYNFGGKYYFNIMQGGSLCYYGYGEETEFKSLINMAIENENIEMIKLLLDNDVIDESRLSCREEGQGDGIESELSKSIDPLVLALEMKNIEICKMILENDKSYDIDVASHYSFSKEFRVYCFDIYKTPLLVAIEKNEIELIKLLLEKKALVDTVPIEFFNGENDENGKHIDLKETIDPIEFAEKMENKEIYELLLERKKNQELEKEPKEEMKDDK